MRHANRFPILAAVGLIAATLLVPAVVLGNARRELGDGATDNARERPLVTLLSGATVTPGPGDSDGGGGAAITVNPASGELCYDINVVGIASATGAGIHRESNGASVVPLIAPSGGSSAGCLGVGASLAQEIYGNAPGFYVNIVNGAFPSGAVRGRLAGGPVSAGSLHSLSEPLRVYDSRGDAAGPLQPNQTRIISLLQGTNGAGGIDIAVPPGASAAAVTLTVTGTTNAGFVKIYNADLGGEPPTSNINWSTSGQNVAVSQPVDVSGAGAVKITGGVAPTHVVIDVIGYYF